MTPFNSLGKRNVLSLSWGEDWYILLKIAIGRGKKCQTIQRKKPEQDWM